MRTMTTPTSESSMRAVRVSGTGRISYTGLPTARKWRNWQTHQLEGLAVAIPWGFESPLPHHVSIQSLALIVADNKRAPNPASRLLFVRILALGPYSGPLRPIVRTGSGNELLSVDSSTASAS